MFPFMPVLVLAKLAVAALDLSITYRQRRRFDAKEPASARISALVSPDTFRRAQAYCHAKASFQLVSGSIDAILEAISTYYFLLPYLWRRASLVSRSSELRQTFVFCIYLTLFSAVVQLPASVYSTFVLEARFGFNRTSISTFIADMFKDFALTIFLGFPLLTIVYYVLKITSTYNVLTVASAMWVMISSMLIIIRYLHPLIIAPLFNKFTPLPDGTLKTRLQLLSQKLQFSLNEIYVIDGSRRSSHSNAFIFGLIRKYICLYDTLLQKSGDNHEQTVSVICHELGHWSHAHLLKQTVMALIHLFIVLLLYANTAGNKDLYYSFGFRDGSMPLIIGLMLFNNILSPIDDLLQPLQNLISRRFEFQADAFAKSHGYSKPLADALVQMSVDNLSNMSPDPLYSAWNYSHPTLLERLDALHVSPTLLSSSISSTTTSSGDPKKDE